MNETQLRIKAYQAALPGLKERVVAVALLLVISITMMTSATFAWLTISRAPEVTGVSTTVAANGNLEIALVNPEGSVPDESKVGDSSAAEGQSVSGSNITWGNLVNLSDPSYGLDNLVLRPAQLNRSALLTSPLYGAVYSQDGRIEKLSSSFGFAVWDTENARFMIKNEPGVRAISSVTVEAVGFAQKVLEKRNAAEEANLMAGSSYLGITGKKEWMSSLATVMGVYMTAKMNSGQGDASLTNPTIEKEDVQNLEAVFEAFVGVYKQQVVAMVEMLNYQLFLQNNSEEGSTAYTDYTYDTLMASGVTEAYLKAQKLQATGLDQLKKDLAKLEDGWAKLQELSVQGSVKWEDSGINAIVNSLMNVGKCTLDGTPVNNIGVSNASGYLDGKSHSAVITNGILYNFEQMNGTNCKVEGMTVSAKVKRMGITIPASITVTITTSAQAPSYNATDLEYADSLNQGAKGVEVAEDTYGLAVDLWVRTNASGSYLTLEGNILTEDVETYPTGKDAAGNTVDLYTLTLTEEGEDGESTSYTIDVYKIETKTTAEDGTETMAATWYNAASHAAITLEEGQNPVRKVEVVQIVTGYEGENRIWSEDTGKLMSTNATTQGSGSCYVYYADTPEDQARSLELLKAFHVAFVDEEGRLLSTAVMDTEHYYADNGRVIVPLVLAAENSIDLGEDAQGNVTYAITALAKNTATRITAIVYLDGTQLSNDQVLAAADIQGQLNIQFGSSQNLTPIDNETLENAILSVSASVDKTSFDYDTATEPMTTMVTLNIDGEQPNSVTAFFLRSINSTQGSRETVMTFTKSEDGTWTAPYTFTVPGNYVLRTVQLDGQEYVLSSTPTVTVTGFAVESLVCKQATNNHASVMTAAASYPVDLELKFSTNDAGKLPRTVQGRFLNDADGSAVNVNFTYNPTNQKWTGTATFLTSGNYTMQYLVLDGEYSQLPEGLWQTAAVFLGMKVAVYTDSPTAFKYLPSEWSEEEYDSKLNLYMKVKVMDNTGEPMEGLNGLTLYYSMQGSAVLEMGMSAPLTWNAVSGYYECAFKSKVGMYDFSNVTVGSNTITNATTFPSFFISSPEPPVFNRGNTDPYIYAPNNDAVMKVLIDNCEAATVYADILKDGSSETVPVSGSLKEGNWVFEVPKDGSGKQDGVWTIKQLRLWNVYDENGNPYTEAAPLVFDLTDEPNVTIKVVSSVKVTVSPLADPDLGKDGETITAQFMDTQTVSGLYVTITDFEDKAIVNADGTLLVSDVKLIYDYGGETKAYGGYTSTGVSATEEMYTVSLTEDGTNAKFVQSGALTVQYAGTYTPKLQYTINGMTYTMPAEKMGNNAPGFAVWSKTPTATITGVTPTGTYSVDNMGSGQLEDSTSNESSGSGFRKQYRYWWVTNSSHVTGYASSYTSTTATVYFKCDHTDIKNYGYTSWYGPGAVGQGLAAIAVLDNVDYHQYTQPTVSIKLADIGNASNAKLSFGDNALIYASAGGTTATTYSWSADGTITRYIGIWGDNGGNDDDTKTVAGTMTATELVLTYDADGNGADEEYKVPVSIKIVNEY